MRLLSLQCKGFKCFENSTFHFSDNTRIEAENFRGKTSIPEAAVYALFGTNITGSAIGIEDYIRKGSKSMEVIVEFEAYGETHEIVRTKGKTSAVMLDGRKSDNNEIARLVGDKAEFLSVFTPGYFAALSNTDARAMVMQLVKMPAKADVLAKMDDSENAILAHEALRDPEAWAKQLRDEIKAVQKEQERSRGQIELLEQRVAAVIDAPIEWDDTELAELIAKRATRKSATADEAHKLDSEISAMRLKYAAEKAKIKEIPNAPLALGDPCLTCQVPLTQEALDAALAVHAQTVRQTERDNTSCRAVLESIVAQGEKLKMQRNALLDSAVDNLDPTLDASIGVYEAYKHQAEQHNARVEQMHAQRNQDDTALAEARRKLEDYEREETRLQSVVRALGLYRAKLAEMQVAQLAQHLDKVSVQLFDVSKSTGEIKPTFDLLYEGREYRTLSYSERIRANLEIATLINRVRGYDWPVFIDNCESITHYVRPAATQVIEAHVVAGAELTIGTKEVDAA